MRGHLVKIGNSRGIRIPKALLEQTGITEDIELEVQGSQIVIRPASHPRGGWDSAFRAMAAKGDDTLVLADENLPHPWDEREWRW